MSTMPKDVRIVFGLGNPGTEYELTRHNAGFLTIDAIAARAGIRYWKSEAGCMVASTETSDGRELLLAKPQDFMNTSGGPVSKLARTHHILPVEILVVHDEVDLAAGLVRVKSGGGLNAHNGLRSIADKLGTRDFARVRVGIGRPPGRMDVATYVLRQLKGDLADGLRLDAEHAADAVEACLEQGVAWAETNFR